MLLGLLSSDNADSASHKYAVQIVNMVGGLPLAISQIANFISLRKLPLKDFPALYERNSAQIDARKGRSSRYEHAVSTVWEISLSRLSGPASHLLNLLAFLNPDVIDEKMLTEGASKVEDMDFEFLLDEME